MRLAAWRDAPELAAVRLARPVLRTQRRALATLSLIGLLATVAETAALALMIPLLDGDLPLGAVGAWLAGLDAADRVALVGGAMVAMLFARSALSWWHARLAVELETDITVGATIEAMRSVGRLPLDFIHDTGQARLLDAAEGAPDALGQLVMEIGEIATSALGLCTIVVAMALLSGPMVLIVVLVGCATMVAVRTLTRRIEPLAEEVVRREELQGEHALSFVESQRLLRASAARDEGIRRFERGAGELARIYKRYEGINATIDPINTLAGALLVIAGLAYAALNPDDLPLVLFFVAMAFRLQPRFSDLDSSRHAILQLAPDVRRLDWLARHAVEEPVEEAVPDGGATGDGPSSARDGAPATLEIAGLRFGYPGQPSLYDGAELTVAAGEFVAITGDSGIGKSTLLELLLRLRRADAGAIRLDGRALERWSRRAWLARVGWVPQRVELLPFSLRDNLCLGIRAPDDAAIEDALKATGAHEFVAALPEGLDTEVGRRGRSFSEGQLQRLGFARALLRRPGLLLLDEPTSALDPYSARRVHEVLDGLRGRVTIVAVVHGEGIAALADRAVRLRAGAFEARGRADRDVA